MGCVYRARLRADGGVSKVVAVKVLGDEVRDDADLARRLRDEARILSQLQHRSIVRVEGLMRLAGRWSIAMEFIEGVDLEQAVARRGAMPVAAVLEVVREVASALHHAHSATGADGTPLRIIHRDLKPANVRINATGDVKVLDFGVARAQFEGREAETRAGGFGSLGYVPPERVDGDELPAGDVYALGVVAWELLSGDRFGAGHLLSKKHAELVQKKLSALPKVSESVRTLIGEMVSFDPDRRPSARDVERRAAALVESTWNSQRLRDWAEAVVPGVIREVAAELPAGPLVGQVLPEESAEEAMSDAPPEPGAPRDGPPRTAGWVTVVRIALWLVVVVALALLVVVLLFAALALGVWVGTVWLAPPPA